MSPDTLTIASRFAGPPRSGNGGYTAGLLARFVTGQVGGPDQTAVQVTLRKPPPLETALTVTQQTGSAQLSAGEVLIAEATCGTFEADLVAPLAVDVARAAEASYAGLADHPFPTCFVCGPARAVGDGLRLRPGMVKPGHSACVWIPDASVRELAWAALDCPGGWASDLHARPLVLGRMTAQLNALPVVGAPLVVVGSLLAVDGRKTLTATALYDSDGTLVGRAEHVWIAIDPTTFFAG